MKTLATRGLAAVGLIGVLLAFMSLPTGGAGTCLLASAVAFGVLGWLESQADEEPGESGVKS